MVSDSDRTNGENEKYSEEFFVKRIQELQSQIRDNLPSIDSAAKDSFADACRAVEACITAKNEAQTLVDKLHKANADKELIEKAEAAVKACQAAEESAGDTMVLTGQKIFESLDVLSSIDESSLLECTVLTQSTPKGLAKWVAEDRSTHEKLLDSFLGNVEWMKQMIIGGGASNGNYGPAISLHSRLLLQIASNDCLASPMRHKIALATALEHATPIEVFKDSSTIIDPVARCWHYIHAYENGALDEHFEKFSVWELRMVVDSNAKDEDLQWGRDFLKAYRPDEIHEDDFAMKYLVSMPKLLASSGSVGESMPTYLPHVFLGLAICQDGCWLSAART